MKLTRLRIENHSRIADVAIEVRDHLVLVGANDVGKSSVLRCLQLILGASVAQLYSHITAEDFREVDHEFIIEVTLTDFSADEKAAFPDEIDIDATTHLESMTVRLNRQWVGIDIWEETHRVVLSRLADTTGILGEVRMSSSVPERTDDGEAAAPFLRVKQRVVEPDGPRWSREKMYRYLLDQDEQSCRGCERIFDDPRHLELGNNTPRSDGGINHVTNRILLWRPCNSAKSNLTCELFPEACFLANIAGNANPDYPGAEATVRCGGPRALARVGPAPSVAIRVRLSRW